MQALGDQFLAGATLADYQHGAAHRRGATGALHGVEKSARLTDELVVPLHAPILSVFSQHLAIRANLD
jgi:hypothetical protein